MKIQSLTQWTSLTIIALSIGLAGFQVSTTTQNLKGDKPEYDEIERLEAIYKSDELDIRELVAKYASARDELDPEAIEALFTLDADQLVSSGEWRFGRDNLVDGMLRSSQRNPGDRTITVERVRFISSDIAIADARYEIKGRGGAPDRNMWSTFIAVQKDGNWRLTAIRNMLPAR